MKKITITIETGSAAFGPDPEVEVARILAVLAERFRRYEHPEIVMDYNGNTVGKVEIED